MDGGWSEWSDWTKCPVKCDWGLRERERKCDNPEPKHGGKQCRGANIQREKCYAGVRCPSEYMINFSKEQKDKWLMA